MRKPLLSLIPSLALSLAIGTTPTAACGPPAHGAGAALAPGPRALDVHPAQAPGAPAPRSSAARPAALYPIPVAQAPTATAQAALGAARGSLAKLSAHALLALDGLTLNVSVPGPGVLKLTLTAKRHGRMVAIGAGSKVFARGGSTALKLALTRAGKGVLAGSGRHGGPRLTVVATFKPQRGAGATVRGVVTLR